MEKFIELVKKYPILYDLSHKDYKNIHKKDKIWDEIGNELIENSDNLRKKWKNLRDSYAKYIRSIKTKTGQAANFSRKWIWADQMEFFKPFLSFATTSSNVQSLEIMDETHCEIHNNVENNLEIDATSPTIVESYLFNNEGDSFEMNISNIPTCSSTPIQNETSNKSSASSSVSGKKGKKRPPSPTSNLGRVINYLEDKKPKNEDEIDCLMLAHAKTMKKFSKKRQIITKMKIAQLIMEQELLNLEEISPATNNTGSSEN